MIQLSPPVSRIVAVGLLLLLVMAVYSLLIAPLWHTYADNAESIAEQHRLLDRYRQVAAGAERLSDKLDALRNKPIAEEGYLQGDNETLVAAQLQSRIRTVVQDSGGKLTTTQVLAGVDDSGFRRIGVRVTMTADIPDLQQVLHSLESDRPYLFLDNLDISGEQARGRDTRSGDLTISFDAYGFMRAEAKPNGGSGGRTPGAS